MLVIYVVIWVMALALPPCQNPAEGKHWKSTATASTTLTNRRVTLENCSRNVAGLTKSQKPAMA